MEIQMLKKLGRLLVLIVAVLVIVLSLGGIFGAWGSAHVMSDVTVKVFSVVQTGVGVVDTAVGRVDTLLQTARSEVQQTGETVTTAAGNLQENKPVLTALNERLETRLGPTVDNIQGGLAPVHDALVKVDNAVSFANSMPFIQERATRLEELDQTLTQLSGLAADVQQLRTTLRTAVTEQSNQLTQGVATALTDLTSRIDSRLADVQTNVRALQLEITALQARIETLQSRLLLIYNLIALLVTLLFGWVIYSQVVVIRHHWSRPSIPVPSPAPPGQGAATVNEKTDAQSAVEIDEGDKAPQIVEANVETPSPEAAPDPPAESTDSEA
jgi:uncharacterized phage infection (PIP) family protein YhgE